MVGLGEPIGTVSLRPRAMLCVLSMGNWPAITITSLSKTWILWLPRDLTPIDFRPAGPG